FRNIAGRSGRARVYTEGDTIVFDNPLGDLRYTGHQHRAELQLRQFVTGEEPGVMSVLGRARGPTDEASMQAVLGSQLLAAIPENPDTMDLDVRLASHMFGVGSDARIAGRFLREAREVATESEEDEEPFAIAASPLRLTELGIAANATGFSPSSCRRILRVL